MGGSQPSIDGEARSGSQLARVRGLEHVRSQIDVGQDWSQQETEDRHSGWLRHRTEASLSRMSFSSSMNQKTPARSYFQHPLQEPHHGPSYGRSSSTTMCLRSIGPVDISRSASQSVREDTAELASLALSELASSRSEHSPARHHTSSIVRRRGDGYFEGQLEQGNLAHRRSNGSSRPDPIEEVLELLTPYSLHSSQQSHRESALTELMKNYLPTEEESCDTDGSEELDVTATSHPVTVRKGIISQPGELTGLLVKRTAYGSIKDIESQKIYDEAQTSKGNVIVQQAMGGISNAARGLRSPRSWNRHDLWKYGIRQPANLLPPVILGLLLNVLDALSYGNMESEYTSDWLTRCRDDSVPPWRCNLRRPWPRWNSHVLCQLYRVAADILAWR